MSAAAILPTWEPGGYPPGACLWAGTLLDDLASHSDLRLASPLCRAPHAGRLCLPFSTAARVLVRAHGLPARPLQPQHLHRLDTSTPVAPRTAASRQLQSPQLPPALPLSRWCRHLGPQGSLPPPASLPCWLLAAKCPARATGRKRSACQAREPSFPHSMFAPCLILPHAPCSLIPAFKSLQIAIRSAHGAPKFFHACKCRTPTSSVPTTRCPCRMPLLL